MPAIPLRGDRSASNMAYPNLHASDIEDGIPVYHTPAPGAPNVVLVSLDGLHWTTQPYTGGGSGSPVSMIRQTIITIAGDCLIRDNPLRIFNMLGTDQYILKVFVSVTTAPTGDDVIVDVRHDGESIFSGDAHRPTILAGYYKGVTTEIDSPNWTQESFLTGHILQVGSSTPGADLVIHIIHIDVSVGGEVRARRPCFIVGIGTDPHASAHAFIEGIAPGQMKASRHCFIKTESADLVGSAHAFVSAVANMPRASAHCFVPVLSQAAWCGKGTIFQFHDEPDPDNEAIVKNIWGKPGVGQPHFQDYENVFTIKYAGMYEIVVYTEGGSAFSQMWTSINGTQISSEEAQAPGNLGGDYNDPHAWANRATNLWHWVGHLNAGDIITAGATRRNPGDPYGDFVESEFIHRTVQPPDFDATYSQKTIVRRIS